MTPAGPSAHAPSALDERSPLPAVARFLSSNTTLVAVVLLATSIAIYAGALSANRGLFDHDEAIYLRVIKLFDGGVSLDLLRTYGGEPASPAPLFFLLYSWFGKGFGFGYTTFRVLSLILTLLAVACLAGFIHIDASRDRRLFFPSLLFIFPYIFCMAFSVMAEPLTLLLTVVALGCYLQGLTRKSNAALLIGAIAATAALHVRIHAVSVPVAVMVVLLLRRDRSVLYWCLALTPILARLPLILLQGGLTVSREAFTQTKPELGFCPSNIHFFFVWFGYVFFPLLWWCHSNRRITFSVTLLLIPVYLLIAPSFLAPEHNGALRTLFLWMGVSATTAKVLAFPFWCVGCCMTIDLIQRIVAGEALREMFLGACIVLFMASLAFSTVAFERYYQLAVPAIVLLGVTPNRRVGGYVAVFACHVLLIASSVARLAADLP